MSQNAEKQVFQKCLKMFENIKQEHKDLPHIFERFYKSKNSSSESVGIGLSLAKSIIESNNGYIQVDSEKGKGCKFIIKYL